MDTRPNDPTDNGDVRAIAMACTSEQTRLGEGVRWDARRGELLRVDILAGRVYRDHVHDDGSLVSVRVYELPWTVGMITPVEGDDGWLLGAGRGFVYLAPDGAHRTIAEASPAGTRMNDGACDPQGRFWAGTLADDHHAGGGALYRLDREGRTELMRDGLTISNGLGWSPDGSTMYLVDSGPRVIQAFAFDAESGTISDGRVLVTIPEEVGAPDGMTVDAAGDVWVAVYGGGRVHRYSPDGVLREVVTVPAEQTTCCAFAGRDLKPALHHHCDRGLERRAASRSPDSWARVPVRHGRDRPPGRAVPSGSRLVVGGDSSQPRPLMPGSAPRRDRHRRARRRTQSSQRAPSSRRCREQRGELPRPGPGAAAATATPAIRSQRPLVT
jgi:sugar lactone lactonase YvrE